MLSISSARSASSAGSYYAHMEKDANGKIGEYYARDGQEQGQWTGSGAEKLGLSGAVSNEDFQKICNGYNPKTDEALMRNAGEADRRAGWDCTFSAPKSVSVAWSVADEATRAKIEDAHNSAVKAGLGVIEEKAGFARTGAQGQQIEKAGLVVATFQHGTSREQDAQLHTHSFVFNSAIRDSGAGASIDSQRMFEYKMAAGAAYQCALADALKKDGFAIERDGDASFRLSAVPRSLEFEQSTRRQQIESHMRENGSSGAAAAAVANLATRKSKGEIDIDALREKWTQQAEKHGFTAEHAKPTPLHHQTNHKENRNDKTLPERNPTQAQSLGAARELGAVPGIDSVRALHERGVDGNAGRSESVLQNNVSHSLEQKTAGAAAELRRPEEHETSGRVSAQAVLRSATEHNAIIKDADILTAAYRLSISKTDAAEAKKVATEAKSEAVQVVHKDASKQTGQDRFTTHELIKAEKFVIDSAVSRQGERAHIASAESIQRAAHRTAELKGYSLNTEQRGALDKLCGEAGGVKVMVGDAGTGKSTTLFAVREAHEAAGMRVIGTSTGGKASAELMQSAGIESRSIAKLQHDIQSGKDALNAKTVLVVDEAGMTDSRAMAGLMKEAQDAGAKVILVGDHKQLQPVGAGETFSRVANEIGSARLEENKRQRNDWERDAVKDMSKGEAAAALAKYIERDRVTVEKSFNAAIKDIAQRQIANTEKYGADKTIAIASTNLAVGRINEELRSALKESGKLTDGQNFTTKLGNKEVAQIELAAGDRVMVGANSKDGLSKNGDTGTVLSGDAAKNTVTVTLDRTGQAVELDASKAALRHGYAITTHKSQGSTYEAVSVYLDKSSSREMAYVQASRARDETHFVTSSHTLKEMSGRFEATAEQKATIDLISAAKLEAGKTDNSFEAAKENFATAAKYIEKNASFAPEAAVAVTEKEQLKMLAGAMSVEKPKESTLDYNVVDAQESIKSDLSSTSLSDSPVFADSSQDSRHLDSYTSDIREIDALLDKLEDRLIDDEKVSDAAIASLEHVDKDMSHESDHDVGMDRG